MKLLLLFIAAFGRIHTSSNNVNGDLGNDTFHSYRLQVLGDLSSDVWLPNHPRVKRDTDANVDTMVSRMQKIARITNGIYLTQGFIYRSISSDVFISEILHLGTVTPTAIKTMGLSKLQTAFNEISNTKLEETEDATRIEKRLLLFEEIRKVTSDIGDTKSLEGADEYKNELTALDNTTLLDEFNNLNNNIKEFLEKVEALEKTPNDSSGLFGGLGIVMKSIGDLEKAVQELKTASSVVKDAMKFEYSSKSDPIFVPISKILKVTSKVEEDAVIFSKTSLDDRGLKVSKANIEKLAKLGLLFMDHQTEMKSIKSIYVTRQKRGTAFSALTSGFPGGSDDLHRIFKDLGDPWIEKLTDNKDSFEKAMGSLNLIGAIAGSIDGFFGSSPDEQLDALEAVTKIGDNVSPYAGNSEEVWASVEEAHRCGFNSLNVPDELSSTQTVISAIEKLKPKIEELRNVQELAKYLAESDQTLTKIVAIISTHRNPPTDFKKILENLKKSTELKEVFNKLKEAKLTKTDNTESPKTSEEIKKILVGFPKIETFQKEITKHVAAVKCLHGVKNFDHVPKVIDAIKSIRHTKPETIQKGTGAVKKVVDATDELERLETAINKLKGGYIPETKALKLLPDQAKHSITLGSATRAIIGLKNALKSQKELDEVLKHLNLVRSELGSVQNLDPELQKNLETLIDLEPKIQKMESDVTAWRAGVEVSSSSKLVDLASVFREAQKVTGIDENLKKLSESVKEFKKNFKNDKSKEENLEELRKALLKLDSAGLKISDHSKYLADAPNSLAVLDVFFVDYYKKLNPPLTPPPMVYPDPARQKPKPAPGPPASHDQNKSGNDEMNVPASSWKYFIGGVATGLLFCTCFCQPRWLKSRKQKKLEKDNERLRRSGRRRPYRIVATPDKVDSASAASINSTSKDRSQPRLQSKKMTKKSEKTPKSEKSEEAKIVVEPPSVKKTRAPKNEDKEERARKIKFGKYLDDKVKQQMKRAPFALLPTGDPNVEKAVEPIFMLFLYNRMMELQNAKGIDSDVLLPTAFFDYCELLFTNGILTSLKDVNVGNYSRFEDENPNFCTNDKRTRTRLQNYSRHNVPINIKTMPSYNNTRVNREDAGLAVLHANYVRLPNKSRIIITQEPLMIKDDPAPYINFVRDVKASSIVMFGSFAEDGIYMPLQPAPKTQIGESDNGEPETVQCGEIGSLGGEIKTRLLTITVPPDQIERNRYRDELREEEESERRRKKEAEHSYRRNFKKVPDRPRENRAQRSKPVKPQDEHIYCAHYQYEAVTSDSVPIDPDSMTRIAANVYNSDRVIVHCSDGLGVSASFAGAIYGFQVISEVLKSEEKEIPRTFLSDLICDIRSHRFGAYKKPIHLALTAMILVEMTFAGKNMMTEENEKIYRELLTCYAKAIDIQNDMNVLETEFRQTPELSKPAPLPAAPAGKEAKSTDKIRLEKPPNKTEKEATLVKETSKKNEGPQEKSVKKPLKDAQKSERKPKPKGDESVAIPLEDTQDDFLGGEAINKSTKDKNKSLKKVSGSF